MMTPPERELVVRADEIEEFSLPGDEHVYRSQCLIDRDGVGSTHLSVSRFTLKAGQALRGTTHASGDDECYYVLRGRAILTLGGDPASGKGARVDEIGPDTAVFIPGGTYHALENPYAEDFVVLTIWPKLPSPGSNKIYDARRRRWGTSFRKRSSVVPKCK